MENWDEVRTAYHVAREGTVSGAAAALGVHHATVIRHIDALEARLGTKLFQRHARGYTATEAGADLMQVAQTTDDQLAQLQSRLRGRGNEVGGELVVTTLATVSMRLAPVLAGFQCRHPDLTVRLLTDNRIFRLEYGEAHVAIRAGSAPNEPDNVVQPFLSSKIGLYASQSYLDRSGGVASEDDLGDHVFVTFDNLQSRAPFYSWLYERVPPEQAKFRTTDNATMLEAIRGGAGLGFVAVWQARRCPELVEVLAPRPEWAAPLWLVTHMDLHRTPKVQAFLTNLKAATKDWDTL